MDIQKLFDATKTIELPKPRLILVGLAVYPELYRIATENIENPQFSLLITQMKYGFRYGNTYFLNSKHISSYTILEVLKPKLKKDIIDCMEKYK